MWFTPREIKVFLGIGSTDMRKSIDSLSILVSKHLEQDPFSGHFFVFCNRRRSILKILYWDRNGFCLWHKRLEQDKFRWPEGEKDLEEMSGRELSWLLEGLDIAQAQSGAHGSLDCKIVY